MGNRSFLYLSNVDAGEDEFEEIADANNLLPTLWHILLAGGGTSPAIDYQRVFGNAETANISSPALQALARFKKFAKYLKKHPRIAEIPALKRYLIAAESHLTQIINDYQTDNDKECFLSASLDELSWLDESSPEVFIAQCVDDFNVTWTKIDSMISAKTYDGLEDVLGFHHPWNLTFSDWNAWSTVFGLALFQHPYFDGTWEEPQIVAFADYDAEDDGESYLGAACYRFKENGLWGIKNQDTGEIVTPAQWEQIRSETEDIYQLDIADDQRRCWVMQDKKFAMMVLGGADKGHLLTSFLFDDTWMFDKDGICIVQLHNKMGYLKRDGSWHIEPVWDEAWEFSNGVAAVSKDKLKGYIDSTGKVIFEPQFDDAYEFIPEGTARVSTGEENQTWSLIRRDGSILLSNCSSVEWSSEFNGWLVERGVNRGLYLATGELWLPVEFHEITSGRRKSILVKQHGKASMLDWSGVKTIMPFEFSDIALFPKQKEARSEADITHQVRVSNVAVRDSEPSYGVWDIQRQKLIVPREFRHIWLVLFGHKNDYGFYVAKVNDHARAKTMGKYSVQLLDSGGVALFNQDFFWLASSASLDKPDVMEKLRKEIFMSWARGKPLAAKIDRKSPQVYLKQDGTICP
jgi:uncharacterized protein